ncbi:MAG: Maf family protein [Dehalococcoidia bacterium]
MSRVVLASASPRRRELLAALVADFAVAPADIDETVDGDPVEAAGKLALAKARAVLSRDDAAVVIGSDTIVADRERMYAKPTGPGDAADMWRALRGRPHLVATGVAVCVGGWPPLVDVSESVVTLTDLGDDAIAAYVASGRPLDKAGGYAIQDEDVPTVASLDGCYCGVMGLPLWTLRTLLEEFGVATRAPHETFARCETCPERTGAVE